MLNPTDIRFKADSRQAAQAWQVQFPILVRVQRPAAVQALADAHRLVDQLRRAAEEADIPDARLAVLDPDADQGGAATSFTVEQKSKQEARVQLAVALAATLEGTGGFWERAAAIAAVSDLLQGFVLRSSDKGTEVEIQQGRVITKGASSADVRPGGTA